MQSKPASQDKMYKIIVISMFVSVVTSQDKGLSEELPPFCNGLACPNFRLLNKTEGYELRSYPRTSWVSTELNGVSNRWASSTMFNRLFQYIGGNNVEGKKIAMTCPVISKVKRCPRATCRNDAMMAFYNDPKEGIAPIPTGNDVALLPMPPMEVYVKSFGGWARSRQYRQAGRTLGEALSRDGLGETYDKDYYYTAGYDSPYKMFDRHNEIWFIKK